MSKRSARGVSSSRSHDSDTVEDCKAAFLIVFGDINQEIVSRKELETVLQQAGRNPTERVLKKYWNSSAKPLTFENFVDICRKEHSTTTDDLMKAFRKIDTNRDGFISKDELYDMMTTKGENMSMAEVKAIIDEVDINKDGKLDYLEFCNMVVNTANDCKKMSRKVMEKIEKKKNKTAAFRSEASPREQKRSHVTPPKPADRHKKGTARSPVSGRIIKLPEPRNIKDWTHLAYKGCFFLEEDNRILSHQYSLQLPTDSHVWITIQPYNVASDLGDEGHPVDTALYVLRDKSDSAANNLVTFTEQRNHTGKYGVRCDLDAGTYLLCPMTSGCRLKPRRTEPKTEAKLIKTEKNGTVTLSKAFKKALEDIFDISDLDGNGLLSREEFSLFSLRTTGEQVADDEWGVVEDNVSMENGEVTKAGFLRLNEMEAEDNDGGTEDSWITLSNMGFNKSLAMDEACPFRVDVYVESCPRARLSVLGMETASMKLENAVCTSIIQKGEISKVKGVKDLNMYTYIGDARASAVLENKSHSRLEVQLNCSRSTNVLSSKGSLDHVVELPGRSMMVAQHLIPDDETAEWSVLFGDASVR